MYEIKIPETVTIEHDYKGEELEEYPWLQWFVDRVLRDPQLAQGKEPITAVFLTADIRRKAKRANGVLRLSDAEYEHVKPAVKSPTGGHNIALMSQCPEYISAVLDAGKVLEE